MTVKAVVTNYTAKGSYFKPQFSQSLPTVKAEGCRGHNDYLNKQSKNQQRLNKSKCHTAVP